ncbi:MAG: hypothetical protein QXV17_14020 [Candidatus Micrarchaeaceae archaeon]
METAKKKAERIVLASFVVVLLIFFVPFGIAQGFQNWSSASASNLSGNSVANANLWNVYQPNGTAIPATTTGTSATFFYPAKMGTANVVTNLTVGQALQNDISNISMHIGSNVKETLTIYLGIGSSNKAFSELYWMTVSITNISRSYLVYFPGQAYWYSFPSTDHFIFVITNATYGSEFTAQVILKGVSGFESAFFNPQVWITATLLFLGIFAFVGAYFATPWVEIHTEKIKGYVRTTRRRISNVRRRKK